MARIATAIASQRRCAGTRALRRARCAGRDDLPVRIHVIRRRVRIEARMTTKGQMIEGMKGGKEYLMAGTKDSIYSSSPPRKVGQQAVRHLSAQVDVPNHRASPYHDGISGGG